MIISFQLLFLEFPSGLFPSDFLVKTLYSFLFSSLNSITRCYLVSTVDAIFVNKHCVRSTRVAIRRPIRNQYRSADGSSQVSSNGKRRCADVIPVLHECIRVGVWNYGPRPEADGDWKRGNENSWHSHSAGDVVWYRSNCIGCWNIQSLNSHVLSFLLSRLQPFC